MENDRRLRFLIPPLIFLGSLIWGAILDPDIHVLQILSVGSKDTGMVQIIQVISILLAGGVAVIAMGFMIGGVTVFLITAVFFLFRQRYEAHVPDNTLELINRRVRVQSSNRDMVSTISFFAYVLLPRRLLQWMDRRWNAFMTSASSAVALTLSHPIVLVLHIQVPILWSVISFFLSAILIINAFIARDDVMKMYIFASSRTDE